MNSTLAMFAAVFLLITVSASSPARAAAKPVRIFILAGQSNMEGQGQIKADPRPNAPPASNGLDAQ